MRRVRYPVLLILSFAASLGAQTSRAKRTLSVGDMYRLKNVSDPQLSPEGKWVAYVVSTTDSVKDKTDSDVWMSAWDGTQAIQVTSSPDGESSPRWSPDGRYLSFLSSRQGGKGAQLWLLDRLGGEAKRVTELKSGIREYEWSPDSKRIALFVSDANPDDAAMRASPTMRSSPNRS